MTDQSNLPAEHGEALNLARLAGNNWRTGRANAKKLCKRLIVLATVHRFEVADLFKTVRAEMGNVHPEDRNNVDRFFSDCRKVIDNWNDFPAEMRRDFLAADAPTYSTLIGDLKARDKAVKAAQATADLETAAADAGVTVEEYSAQQARNSTSNATVGAIEMVIALIDREERTGDENAALARLIDKIADFSAEAVKVAA